MRLLSLIVILWASARLGAQTTTAQPTGVKLSPNVQPTTIVLNRFNAAYPNISPEWTYQGDVYNAQYRNPDNNLDRVVSYDAQGNIVAIENELTEKAYPEAIAQYYQRKHPGERFTVWSREDGLGNKMYYILRGEESTWFSEEGRLIPNTGGNKRSARQTGR